MSSSQAFDLLAPPIQRILWDMRWRSLRPIQETAIQMIASGNADIIISARTASGKTEAAFLPILSQIYSSRLPSIQAVYVGPLKALINDQFRRLESLCERARIPVHRWHGDVGGGRKKAMIQTPGGVLLITPESIESLLLNRTHMLDRVFRHLQFAVIDEVHSLIGVERGTHLRSLLSRIRRYTQHDFRVIGLSATLGDSFPEYRNWFRPDADREVQLINGTGDSKRLLFKIHAFLRSPPPKPSEDVEASEELPKGLSEEMYRHFAGSKNLIFANSKSDVEQFADALNAHCRGDGRAEEFMVHHGSLSKESREFTEREMQGRRPRTTVCSATLELGIDIGNVRAVGQVDPPWSVSSQVQRLGRSGRGDDEPQCMRLYISENPITAKSSLLDKLHLDLLRAIAITELMLESPPWVEPPRVDRFDLSTFTHQLLSILAETGGCQAGRMFEMLCVAGAFRAIDSRKFARVLRCLGDKELIEQMPQGDLILAPKGEQMVRHYSFYSAFATGIDYSVLHRSTPIGMLPSESLPKMDDHFLLGGRRWQVIGLDDNRREINVRPARGKKPPRFFGGGGDIHPRIREKMREVVLDSRAFSYLDETALRLLQDSRNTARNSGLSHQTFVPLSPSRCLWFTWTGTRVQRTLCLIAETLGMRAIDRDVAIEFEDFGAAETVAKLSSIKQEHVDAIQLANLLPGKQFRKLDYLLSEELLAESLAVDFIDIEGAFACLKR